MGLMTLNEMETIDIELIINDREVGLEVDNGKQVGAINMHWRMWQPNIGFGFMTRFGHCVVSFLALFPLRSRENTTSRVNDKYGTVLVFVACCWFVS